MEETKPEEVLEKVENEEAVLTKTVSENEAVEADDMFLPQSHVDMQDDDTELSDIAHMKKNDAAEMLIEKSKTIVAEAEAQMEACKLLLDEDLKGYGAAKQSLEHNALNESEELIAALGFEKEQDEDGEQEEVVVFEQKEELPPFVVKEVSNGKFTGFLMAIIAGVLTFAGMVYLATEKTGITLDVTKLPDNETAKAVFGWYATLFGGKPDLFLGGAFVLIVTLFVMWVVYAVRVSLKASGNLAFAKQQFTDAKSYVDQKGNCKEEMDKVDAHIQDAIATMKSFEVLLHEQNAKLKRIMHIEGERSSSEYHVKSHDEMQHAYALINAIRSFMATPMSEEGRLSEKSVALLENAKAQLQKMLDKLYN